MSQLANQKFAVVTRRRAPPASARALALRFDRPKGAECRLRFPDGPANS